MKALTDKMKEALRQLYQDSIDSKPFYPPEAGIGCGGIHGNVAKGLIERGLATKVRYGHQITRKGVELAEEMKLQIHWVSQWNDEWLKNLQQAKISFRSYKDSVDVYNPSYCASVWRKKSLHLRCEAITDWDKGGIIQDYKKNDESDIYQYMSLLALEDAMN